MKKYRLLGVLLLFLTCATAQENNYIFSKDGKPVLNKRDFVFNCLRSMNKNRTDQTALSVCECQAEKLNRKFTSRQIKSYTYNGVVYVKGLLSEDSITRNEIQKCFENSGKTILLQAEGFEENFIEWCKESIIKGTIKKLDSNKVKTFCACELNLIKQKKLTDKELNELSNPNSLLFYEISFKCGSPFETSQEPSKNWNEHFKDDLTGPASDTIPMLTMSGMSLIKITIGGNTQVWILDTGATDLLINKETEEQLKKQNILNTSNYIGITEYEMANGTIDSCRKYKVNGVKIGGYKVDNVIIAVSDKGRQLLVGKSLLNKFSSWIMDNKNKVLMLTK